MNLQTFLSGELRSGLQRMGENAQRAGESLDASSRRLIESENRADLSDEAAVELAGLVDTALTCIDEQNAALVELAGLLDSGTIGGE